MVVDNEQLLRLQQKKLKTQEDYEAEEEQRTLVDAHTQGSVDLFFKVPNPHHAIRKEGVKRSTSQLTWRQRAITL